jgi:fucose 4-O-acetylase-like acetyltransferase
MSDPYTSSPPSHGPRIGWVDTAKGLGIILVVLGHVLRGLVASNILTLTPTAAFIDAWIYAFHMPLFFFLSGLFLARSAAKPAADFIWDKIGSVAYPYLVWSTITLLLKSPLGQLVNQPRTLLQIPDVLITPIEQYWFLYVLFLLSIGLGLLLKLGMNPWVIVPTALVFYPSVWPFPWSGWLPFELARSNAIYVALGVMVGAHQFPFRLSSSDPKMLAATALAGFLLVTLLVAFLESPYPYSLNLILAVSGTAAVIAIAILADRLAIGSAVSLLGQYSLEIYVAHSIASASVRIVLQHYLQVSGHAPYVLFCTVAGLYAPILLAVGLRRIGIKCAFALPKRSEPNNQPAKTKSGVAS